MNYDILQVKPEGRNRNIQHKKITEYIRKKGSISRSEVENVLRIKQTLAIKIISEMLQKWINISNRK